MIAKLKGLVDEVNEGSIVIDVNGVGYLVSCATSTLANLAPGTATTLFIETVVREDQFSLFGFASAAERDWFRLLTSVQSVGAKVALAVLSTMDADQLTLAVGAEDKAMISRTKGVGPKMAQRIVTELKDKMGGLALSTVQKNQPSPAAGKTATSSGSTVLRDGVSALINLGFGRTEAQGVIARLLTDNPDITEGEAIRLGLKELSQQ